MQFLTAEHARGEKCLFITISESPAELRQVAKTAGLSLDGIELVDCVPETCFNADNNHSMTHASQLELEPYVQAVIAALIAAKPILAVLEPLLSHSRNVGFNLALYTGSEVLLSDRHI